MTATIFFRPTEVSRGGRKVTRWNRRLLFGAIAVLVPALAGCEAGFNAPTLTFHPAAFGVNQTKNGITIDNAFVLGSPPGSVLPSGGQAGVFLSLEAQNGDRLVSVSASGAAASVTIDSGSVNLPAQALVSLSGPAPKVVLTGLTSPVSGGQTIQLSFNFAEAGTITLALPVEPRAYEYATYSPPAIPVPSAAASKKPHLQTSTSVSPSATP
jgi:copper(I)-binding protein